MSDERWNDDIAYAFSVHKIWLRLFGLWPLDKLTISVIIQQCSILFIALMVLPFVTLDLLYTEDAGGNLENIIYCVAIAVGNVKFICVSVSRKRLCVNVNAAIDDWLLAKNDEDTRKIMRKYALRTRILTLLLLYACLVCFFAYIFGVAFINLQQIFFTDPNLIDANFTTTNWILLIPSGPLSNFVTGTQFIMILTLQIFQLAMLCVLQPILDSFFFNITMYLTSQLEVIKNKFETFANEPNTEANRKKFINLINRHGELMENYQNLEDSFHFLILFQLVVTTLMFALIGLRIIVCLSENNYMEATKSMLGLNYMFMQSLVFTYAGDFLQGESEGIFHALYTTSWFTLPVEFMKDLHFAMMRANIPFRLTGGKFFYVNRETMMYVLKTAASYISVLRIALLNK